MTDRDDDYRDDFIRGLEMGAGASGAGEGPSKKVWFLWFLPFILLITIGDQVYDIWWSIFPR